MKNMLKLLLIILFSTPVLVAGAQDMVILASGDTLRGAIDLMLPGDIYEEISFENDEKKARYKAHEFVSFVDEGLEYRTIKFGDKYRIMQLESDGYLSLLRYRADQSYSYNAQFLYKRSGNGTDVPNFMFKKAMTNYLDDCDPVSAAIEEGVYRKKDITQLVEDYNECMNAKTEKKMEEYAIAERKARIEETTTPLIDELTNLQKQSRQLNDKELTSMLDDVITKLKTGEKVPNYLKNALKDHVKDGHELKQVVEVLADQL